MAKTKEYVTLLSSLSKENRKTIKKMHHYLETCYINEAVFEDMMCDLAGMALECEKSGERFSERIGMDYKSFCRELAKNAKKQSVLERILDVSSWLLFFDGIIIPLLYILYTVFFGFSSSYIERLVITAPAGQLLMYFSVSTVFIIGWFAVKRFTYNAQTVVLAIYIGGVLGTFLLTDFIGKKYMLGSVSVNIIYWTIAIALLMLVCFLAKRLTAFRLAYRVENRKK